MERHYAVRVIGSTPLRRSGPAVPMSVAILDSFKRVAESNAIKLMERIAGRDPEWIDDESTTRTMRLCDARIDADPSVPFRV